jgi:sugar phosphate isomerase/epimerase
VRLPGHDRLHLTYCTNIHPASGWNAVFENLARYGPALKARFSPRDPFGIGLRLSAQEARELLTDDRLDRFRAFLDESGLYVAIINGFPYGAFHGTAVKADVYAPDWRQDARVQYTLDLIEILAKLLPGGVDGGISTAPLSYKSWMPSEDGEGWDAITRNVVRVAEALVRVREETNHVIHLDIEPEPDCSIEDVDETVGFFTNRLLASGARMLGGSLGMPEETARTRLLEHIQVCFDCCHFAVEYEDPLTAIARLGNAGIRIGRVQLSSALKVRFPTDQADCGESADGLKPFADAVYLHQVVERGDTSLRRFPDLDPALAHSAAACGKEWRIHFHVPLFTDRYDRFESTQGYVRDVLQHMLRTGETTHLEIETYTWDVLPARLKKELFDSIAREYDWVLANVSSRGSARLDE